MKSFSIAFFISSVITVFAQQDYTRTLKLMGSRFDITVEAKNTTEADKFIDLAVNEIKRIEKIISSWDAESETSAVIHNAGIKPVQVSPELFGLIERSQAISKITDGAFDISFASMDKIWKFDGSMTAMPSQEAIDMAKAKIAYQNIILDKNKYTVFLKEKGMKIGFGGIGKGYAADKAKELLIAHGVKAGIINASGDMNTWGTQLDGNAWTVAITNPMNKKNAFGTFSISDRAIVTSGDYEKYIMFDGKRYAHIINPKTGYPTTGIISVSVFAPKAEMADALATAVFVMGKESGLNLIEQIPDTECILVDDQGKIFKTKNIHINEN